MVTWILLALCLGIIWLIFRGGKKSSGHSAKGIIVTSASGSGNKYIIDPDAMTCTCLDWAEQRKSAAENSPSRLCRHLCAFFGKNPEKLSPDLSPFKLIIEERAQSGKPFPVAGPDLQVRYGLVDGKGYVITLQRQHYPWASVFFDGAQFRLNLDEKRWSYGERPEKTLFFIEQTYALAGIDPNSVAEVEFAIPPSPELRNH